MERISDYRKRHIESRDAMSPAQVDTCSQKICGYLLEADWYQKAELIFSYEPLGNEVSTRPFHEKAWEDGKKLALPKVMGETMKFFAVSGYEDLEKGSFGILEPKEGCPEMMPEEGTYLVVLVPGVVFDEKGNRYGHGKGYYDRFFAQYPFVRHRYGLAYEHQMEKELPVQKTDVPMSRIYTEIGCRRYKK